jgi:hypothetical protein
MMRNLFLVLFAMAFTQPVWCQPPQEERMPARTAEEEAMKQTERLTRELEISDTLTRDTLYRLHLKYAVLRRQGLTRAQHLQYMQAATDELSHILSPDQFDRFMNHQSSMHPRMPQAPTSRMPHPEDRPMPKDSVRLPDPAMEPEGTPYTPEAPAPLPQ